MQEGFIVDMTNNTSSAKKVKLFADTLPEGISLNTIDKAYDFEALKKIAQENVFLGNSITTGFEDGLQIEIVNKDKITKVMLNGRYESPEIRINGNEEFVSIICPPNSNFYIRLVACHRN
jgi:hypothetical protein